MKKNSLYKPFMANRNSPRLGDLPSAVPLEGLRESLLTAQNIKPGKDAPGIKTRKVTDGKQGVADSEG